MSKAGMYVAGGAGLLAIVKGPELINSISGLADSLGLLLVVIAFTVALAASGKLLYGQLSEKEDVDV